MKKLKEIIKIIESTAELIEKEKSQNAFYKKGDFNFVTALDIKVQDYLGEKLYKLAPDVQFLSEENSAEIDFSKPTWVLDPVDGTTNLMHGFRNFTVSLGLWDGEQLSCGVVFDPTNNEMFYAKRGEGAYLNGEKIHVAQKSKIADCLIAVETSPYNKSAAEENFKIISEVFKCCRDIRCIGSSALDFAYLACGRVDAYFTMEIWPWDFAGGVVIAEEAGAMVTDWEWYPLNVKSKKTSVLAANPTIYDEIYPFIVRDAQKS